MTNDLFSMFDLTGKRALISGASSGLGLHLAGVLAQAGASVALAARRADKLHEAVATLQRSGCRACAVPLDITQPAAIAPAFDEAERALDGPIDILINNAAILYSEKFTEQKLQEIERVFDTNLKGSFLVAQEAARRMSVLGAGSIINVSSTAGLRAGGHLSSYGAAKAGLIHLTKIMALELAQAGVRVNVICPGNMKTEMHNVFVEAGWEDRLLRRIPMRKFGEPSQLAGPTLLLASDAGSYMTGVVLNVDGGQILTWV